MPSECPHLFGGVSGLLAWSWPESRRCRHWRRLEDRIRRPESTECHWLSELFCASWAAAAPTNRQAIKAIAASASQRFSASLCAARCRRCSGRFQDGADDVGGQPLDFGLQPARAAAMSCSMASLGLANLLLGTSSRFGHCLGTHLLGLLTPRFLRLEDRQTCLTQLLLVLLGSRFRGGYVRARLQNRSLGPLATLLQNALQQACVPDSDKSRTATAAAPPSGWRRAVIRLLV